ncbi:nicotinate-nucleotide--dimethylbenzimidazole phosphoribosyltransferase [Candidatus Dependentiae bacterium]|nr:nicotinate-nucleotide--dimethylbenzimidazole phosphoribosyltransferase [Candidatus Dependentiae bacterium]
MNLNEQIQLKLDSLTKPKDSLGDLEKIALKLGMIQQTDKPVIKQKGTIVFAADHGVVKHKVSAFPKEVTVQMVLNFLNNGAAINVLSNFVNSKVFVVDSGVDYDFDEKCGVIKNKIMKGTGDIYLDKAMSLEQAKKNVELGKNLVLKLISEHNLDLITLGEMGIGNTTPATAIIGIICGLDSDKITGRGTGINNESLRIKEKIISSVIKKLSGQNDPFIILSETGGLEIAQMAGAIIACYEKKIPVVIDGLICTGAALISYLINNKTPDYMFAGHKSFEPGHIFALKKLGLKPILDLDMRLGEGTGAVLAMNIIEASTRIINEMATFDTAGVSKKI